MKIVLKNFGFFFKVYLKVVNVFFFLFLSDVKKNKNEINDNELIN